MSQRASIQLLRTDPTPPARRSMHPVTTFDLLPHLTNSMEFNKALFYQERCKQRAKCALSWRSSGISLGYTSPCNDSPLEYDIKNNKTCNHVQSKLSIYKVVILQIFQGICCRALWGEQKCGEGSGLGRETSGTFCSETREKKLNSKQVHTV